MVKSKKMSKTSIAIIVLALLLVLSMVMGLTGAWFTSSDKNGPNGESATINMGSVKVALTADTAMGAVQYGSRNGDAVVQKLVDGDNLTIVYGVDNTSDVDIYYAIKSLSVKVYADSTKENELADYERYFKAYVGEATTPVTLAQAFASQTTAQKLVNGEDVANTTVKLVFDSEGLANHALPDTQASIYIEFIIEVGAVQAAHISAADAMKVINGQPVTGFID